MVKNEMTWEKYLIDWKNDKIQPMTHPKIDKSYAEGRLNLGRRYVKHLKMNLKDKKVLDVAVGSGGILCAFAEAGAICYGLDVNDYFLSMSKARFKDLHLKYKIIDKWKGGGYNIPYKSNFFDFVICMDTLEHSPKWKFFVKEMCRVLKNNGYVLFTTERRTFPYFILKNPHDDMPFTILLPRRARMFIDKKILNKPSLDHHFFSRSSEIKEEFKKHSVLMKDFDDVKRERFEETGFPNFLWRIYNLMFISLLGKKEPYVLNIRKRRRIFDKS